MREADIERLAQRVVDLLEERRTPEELLTAAEVAERFSLSRSYVYEQARALGAIELPPSRRGERANARSGGGRTPRLRFDPIAVGRALTAREGSEQSPAPESPVGKPHRRLRRPARKGTAGPAGAQTRGEVA